VIALILGAFLVNENRSLEQRKKVVAALLRHERDGLDLQGSAGAVAKVVPTDSGSMFVASGLHEAPADHTYQLWLIKNGTPVSAGTFTIKGGLAVLESSLQLDGYEQAAVTVEPAGGSQQPTTQPIITSG
jgi:anti-sigma-K factor RskA